jgi:hypothetical protein
MVQTHDVRTQIHEYRSVSSDETMNKNCTWKTEERNKEVRPDPLLPARIRWALDLFLGSEQEGGDKR